MQNRTGARATGVDMTTGSAVRRHRKTRLVGILLCLPGLVVAGVSFPEIKTVVDLSADGSVHMVQDLTCRFDRSGQAVRLTYPAPFPRSRVTLNRLTEQSRLGQGPVEDVETRAEYGTLVVKWNPRAHDETKHYIIDLTVQHAARRYGDVALLHIPIIGAAPGPVERATVELHLPSAATRTFRFYDGDPNAGTVDQDRRTGSLTRCDMEWGDRLTIDAVTDLTVFKDAPLPLELRPPPIRRTAIPPWWLAPIPGLLLLVLPPLIALALLLVLYLVYGREPHVDYDVRYEHEPPGRIPPLAVPAIMRQQPDLTELPVQTLDATLATLLDAARNGVLDILPGDARTGGGRGFVLAHPDRLDALDDLSKNVVSYYFSSVGRGRDSVTADDIRRHALEQPDAFRFWLKLMSQEGRDWWWKNLGVDFLEPASFTAYQSFCWIAPILTGLGWLLVPLGFAGLSDTPSSRLRGALFALTFLLSRMVYVHLGRVILRWSPPAYHEHLRWQSFRRFLVECSTIGHAPIELSAIWQEYYVYAVALGIGERFMHGLSSLATAMNWKVELLWWRTLEGVAVGFAGPPPEPHTREVLGQSIGPMLEAFRSGSGLQGERPSRLQPSTLRRAGKQ
ncbi:MAG: DUF2207 domain-containing protein [candidate division WOR-3 bacterium]|nr:DUF2207 domain-containing protein [candidate division WOR-3 bacterium]